MTKPKTEGGNDDLFCKLGAKIWIARKRASGLSQG